MGEVKWTGIKGERSLFSRKPNSSYNETLNIIEYLSM